VHSRIKDALRSQLLSLLLRGLAEPVAAEGVAHAAAGLGGAAVAVEAALASSALLLGRAAGLALFLFEVGLGLHAEGDALAGTSVVKVTKLRHFTIFK
jgi:hypothetical protein